MSDGNRKPKQLVGIQSMSVNRINLCSELGSPGWGRMLSALVSEVM